MMPSAPDAPLRLASRQKWRLALSLSLLYFPILLYINSPGWPHSWAAVQQGLPLHVFLTGIAMLLYYVWLNGVEWLQARLYNWFGEDFLLELRLPALLLTLALSLGLAVAYLATLGATLGLLNRVVPLFPQLLPKAMPTGEYLALFGRANNSFFLMLMLSTFYLLAMSQALLRVRAFHRRTEQLETENLQAQLSALKNQVNPHFLFNSLSILSSLVHVDADLSEQFIDRLAQAYRYTLEQRDHDLVPLATELEFIQAYTFLLKIRFEEKLDVRLAVAEGAQQHYRIAPLTLQLLVENAVKHNQMSAEHPLQVHISLEADELVVRNTLQLRPAVATPSTHVGLQNIQNRYRLLTTRPVQVSEATDEFVVRVPLLP